MLTVLCSAKGSPGATSTGLALAAAWPNAVTLVEADEAGSDLAVRVRTSAGQALPETPTVATLAAAAREREVNPHLVRRWGQALNEQVHVIPGVGSQESAAALISLWDGLANALSASETDVLVDVGRLHTGSPTMALVQAADAVVVVCRADPASLIHLRERVRHLGATLGRGRRRAAPIVPLIVTSARTADRDVADVAMVLAQAGLTVEAPLYISWDVKTLQLLEQGHTPAGRLSKTALLRSAQQASDRLLAQRAPVETGGGLS